MSSSGTPSRQSTAADDEQGSQPLMMMESLSDKLKLLNYEEGFIKSLKMRPLNRFVLMDFSVSDTPESSFIISLVFSTSHQP